MTPCFTASCQSRMCAARIFLAISFGAGDQQERLLQPRHAAVVIDMRQIRRQPVARRRRLQHHLRAAMDHEIGRPEHAGAERLDQEFQHRRPTNRFGRLARISAKRILDGLEAARHAPFEQRKIGLLAALVLPALQRGRQADTVRTGYRRTAPTAFPCASARRRASAAPCRRTARTPRNSARAGDRTRSRRRRPAPARTCRRSSCGPRPGTAWSRCGRHASRTPCRRRRVPWRDRLRRARSSRPADKDARGWRPARTRSDCGSGCWRPRP